jgi:hypothetical protein
LGKPLHFLAEGVGGKVWRLRNLLLDRAAAWQRCFHRVVGVINRLLLLLLLLLLLRGKVVQSVPIWLPSRGAHCGLPCKLAVCQACLASRTKLLCA